MDASFIKRRKIARLYLEPPRRDRVRRATLSLEIIGGCFDAGFDGGVRALGCRAAMACGRGRWIIIHSDAVHCLVQWEGKAAEEGLTIHSFCGVRVISQSWHCGTGGAQYAVRVVVPFWLLGLLLAVSPALWIYELQRRIRQRSRNLCANCGYDLRATPERCPECGIVRVARRGESCTGLKTEGRSP